jgi:lambda repressor-like predicted transcriptional regulator
VGEVVLEFAVFTREAFEFQRIAVEAERMRRLGLSLRAVGAALGVDEKTVRNALRRPLRIPPIMTAQIARS